MPISTDCRRCLTAKEVSKFALVFRYLKLEVINLGLNLTVVFLSFVIETERKGHWRKEDIAWGIGLFSIVVLTAYLYHIFIIWTNNSMSFCPHDQQKALVTCPPHVLICHCTNETVLWTTRHYEYQGGEPIIVVYFWQLHLKCFTLCMHQRAF